MSAPRIMKSSRERPCLHSPERHPQKLARGLGFVACRRPMVPPAFSRDPMLGVLLAQLRQLLMFCVRIACRPGFASLVLPSCESLIIAVNLPVLNLLWASFKLNP